MPFRAGDAVRIGLFARVLPNRERLWTTGGAFAALGAARAVVLGALVVGGAAAGFVPLWPLLVAAGLVAIGDRRRDRRPPDALPPPRRLPRARPRPHGAPCG